MKGDKNKREKVEPIFQWLGQNPRIFLAWLLWGIIVLPILSILIYVTAQIPSNYAKRMLSQEKLKQTSSQSQEQPFNLDSLECERQLKKLNADEEEERNRVARETKEINEWAVVMDYKIKLGVDPFHPNSGRDDPPQPARQKAFMDTLRLVYNSKIEKLNSESNPKLKRIQADREFYQKRLALIKPHD